MRNGVFQHAASDQYTKETRAMDAHHYTTKDIQRFWAKVDKSASDDACWIWQAATNDYRGGYGQFGVGDRKHHHNRPAHRVAYEITFGVIPPDLYVCHRCDNPRCVNPAHLWLGTQLDNVRDMMRKNRQNHTNKASGDRNGMRMHPESVLRGSSNPGAKFTTADVDYIRKRYAQGDVTLKSLADQFGVNKSTIGKIVRGITYSDD
jgi:hypothetical protein